MPAVALVLHLTVPMVGPRTCSLGGQLTLGPLGQGGKRHRSHKAVGALTQALNNNTANDREEG